VSSIFIFKIFKYLDALVFVKKNDDNYKTLLKWNFLDKTKTILNLRSCRGLRLINWKNYNHQKCIPRITYKVLGQSFFCHRRLLRNNIQETVIFFPLRFQLRTNWV